MLSGMQITLAGLIFTNGHHLQRVTPQECQLLDGPIVAAADFVSCVIQSGFILPYVL